MSGTESSSEGTGISNGGTVDTATKTGGELSEIVTELLTIMGENPDPVVDLPVAPQGPALSGQDLRADRQAMKDEFNKTYTASPPGATATQRKQLENLRTQFTNLLGENPEDAEYHKLVKAVFNDLVKAHQDVRVEVAKTEAKRKQLQAALDQALPAERKPLAEGTKVEDVEDLFTRREQIAEALKAPDKDAPGTPLSDVADQAEKIIALHQDVQAFVAREAKRRSLRTQLDKAIPPEASKPEDIVPGANEDDVKDLFTTRTTIASVLGDKSATIEDLDKLVPQIGGLENRIALLPDTVEQRQARKTQIDVAARKIEEDLLRIPAVDPEALKSTRNQLTKALATSPMTNGALNTAGDLLVELGTDLAAARQDALDRVSRAETLKQQVTAMQQLAGDNCDTFADIKTIRSELGAILTSLNKTANLYEVDLDDVPDQLAELRKQLDLGGQKMVSAQKFNEDKKKGAIAYLTQAGKEAVKEARELAELLGEDDVSTDVGELHGQLAEKLKKANQQTLRDAFDLIFGMRSKLKETRELGARDLERRASQRSRLLQVIAAADPEPLPNGYADMLEEDREAVRKPLGDKMGPDIDDVAIQEARTAATRFEDDLGHAKDIAALWDESAFTTERGKARGPMQTELDKNRALVLAAKSLADGLARCKALAQLLGQAKSEQGKADTAKQAIGEVEIKGKKLDSKIAAEIYDIVGPDAVTGLDDPAMTTLCSCFADAPEDRAALRSLVAEGFGAQGKVLAKLLRSGDKEAVLVLARGYAGEGAKDDRARLRSLVVDGGLGEAPDVLDDLLSQGVAAQKDEQKGTKRAANVERLKKLGASFGDADGPTRMKTLVGDCGFGQSRTETPPRPGILAEMLDGGFDGNTDSMRSFADQFAGTGPNDETDRKRLKALVQEGGFGDRPKAFAPLLKSLSTGGIAGGAKALKEIGTEFRDKADRDKLKRVLESGGISGDTAAPDGTPDQARKHEHADTLAKVFTDGFGKDAAKLKKFAGAFGDTNEHAQQCKGMMLAWNEYGDTHADKRQPGKQIKRLLSPGKLGENGVAELQSTFTEKLKGIGDEGKRKQATRFAPYFDKKPMGKTWINKTQRSADMEDANVDGVEGYLLKRHTPAYFNKQKMGNAALHSQFPPDADVAALIDEALQQLGANAANKAGDDLILNVGNPKLLVQIGFCVSNGEILVNHFTPWKPVPNPDKGRVASPQPPDPNEIGDFNTAETNTLLSSINQ